MNKTKKSVLLGLLLLLTISIVVAVILCNNNVHIVNAFNNGETKKYCNATIEDEFVDNKVIVVLSQEESSKLKDYSVDDFCDIETVCDVDELTYYTKELLKKNCSGNYLEQYANISDIDSFNSILSLTLNVHSKQNVLNVIRILEERPYIISAEPDYTMESNAVSDDEHFVSGNLWWLNGEYGIDIEGAWEITKGSSSVRVGIIDSGINIYGGKS